ncbi:MAG: GH116 family glycosyl-hydrolase [Candidatus Sumerlaeota bacterium]|nr:GH116 family glycosyl-hydrolase [Candidatus Sumerlaeota bacterium]
MAALFAPSGGWGAPRVEVSGDYTVVSARESVAPVAPAAPAAAELFQKAYHGRDFRFNVSGLPFGPLVIELGFAEIEYPGVKQRSFNADINAKRALTRFDPAGAAGGVNRGITRRFAITPQSGLLVIRFTAADSDALVCYAHVIGKGVDVIIKPETLGSASPVPLAGWDPLNAVVMQDEHTRPWPSGVPLGGLGTGKIEILSNGAFANMTINNSWDMPVERARGTFLAVAAKASSGGGMARIMRVREPAMEADGQVEYANARSMPSCRYSGLFPFAQWTFADNSLPVKVSMNAHSAIVPHDERDSALPAVFLTVEVANPNRYPVSAAVALSWEDVNGRGGSRAPSDQFGLAPLPVQNDAGTSGLFGIHFFTDAIDAGRRAAFIGDYFVGVETPGFVVTRILKWNPGERDIPWWKQFASTCRLERRQVSPQRRPQATADMGTGAAVVCASFNLAPSEIRAVPFIITWNMPNAMTPRELSARQAKPFYTSRFASAVGVAEYAVSKRGALRGAAREWQGMITESGLPRWTQAMLLNAAFPVTANSVFLADGRYSMLESPFDLNGALGAIDQRMAAMPFLTAFFPSLNASELELFAHVQQPDGQIPRYVGNLHEAWGTPETSFGVAGWPDLTCSWIIQVAAHYRSTGDTEFLRRNYDRMRRALEFLENADTDGDEIPEGGSPFDRARAPQAGSFVYTAGCYLAALKAARAAAHDMGDTLTALLLEGRFARVQEAMISELWRGDHFIKQFDPKETRAAPDTSFLFALAGDWMARAAGLDGTLPSDRATTAMMSLLRLHAEPFRPVPAMETRDDGSAAVTEGACDLPLAVPYLACEAMRLGQPDAGMGLLARIYQTVWDVNRNPWHEALRYDSPAGAGQKPASHMAALAAWNALAGLTGFVYDARAETIYYDPRLPAELKIGRVRLPVFTPRFWAWIDHNDKTASATLTVVKVFQTPGSEEPRIRRIARSADDPTTESVRIFDPPAALSEGAVIPLRRSGVKMWLE